MRWKRLAQLPFQLILWGEKETIYWFTDWWSLHWERELKRTISAAVQIFKFFSKWGILRRKSILLSEKQVNRVLLCDLDDRFLLHSFFWEIQQKKSSNYIANQILNTRLSNKRPHKREKSNFQNVFTKDTFYPFSLSN